MNNGCWWDEIEMMISFLTGIVKNNVMGAGA